MSNSIGHLTGLNVTKAQLREEYVARNWHHLHKVTDVVRANCEQHREEYREYIREEEDPELTNEQIDPTLDSIIDRFLYKVADKIIDIVLHKGDDFSVDISRGEFREGLFTCTSSIMWPNSDGFDIKTSIRWNRSSVLTQDFFVQYPLTFSKIVHNNQVSTNTAQMDVGQTFGVPEWAAPARFLKKITYNISRGSIVLLSDHTLAYVARVGSDDIHVFGERGALKVPETSIIAIIGQCKYNFSNEYDYRSWFGKKTPMANHEEIIRRTTRRPVRQEVVREVPHPVLGAFGFSHRQRTEQVVWQDVEQEQTEKFMLFDPANQKAKRHRSKCRDWSELWTKTFGDEVQTMRDDAEQILNLIGELRDFAKHRHTINRFFMIGHGDAVRSEDYVDFVPTPITDAMYEVRPMRIQRVAEQPVVANPVANGIWKKLRNGVWGIQVTEPTGNPLRVGDAVTVTKRNGRSSVEIIEDIVSRNEQGVLCSVKNRQQD